MLSQAVTNCNGSEVSSTHRLSGALATAWGQLLGQRLSSPSLAGAAGARLSAFGVSALEPQFPHGDAQRRRVMSAHVERTLYLGSLGLRRSPGPGSTAALCSREECQPCTGWPIAAQTAQGGAWSGSSQGAAPSSAEAPRCRSAVWTVAVLRGKGLGLVTVASLGTARGQGARPAAPPSLPRCEGRPHTPLPWPCSHWTLHLVCIFNNSFCLSPAF